MPSAKHKHSSIAHRRGRKNKRSSSGKKLRRTHSHKASGNHPTVSAQKISSPRIRAVHPALEDSIDAFDFGFKNLFKEERERVQSIVQDDKAPMCLAALFDEDRQIDVESFCLDVLFGEGTDDDVDDHWAQDFGLRELFDNGTDERGARRPWAGTNIAWMAAAGAVVAVPLLAWALRRY
eukprot:evm.model.scf_25EXC.12 EVM.evm.TU.scf_25EXC.12   scf_25EXC:14730-15903(-)